MKGSVFEKKKKKQESEREGNWEWHFTKWRKLFLLPTLWSKTGAEWTSHFENTAFILHKNFWNRSIQIHLLQVNFIEGISQSFMEINDIFLWSETMEMAECVRVAKFVPNV